MRNHQQHTFCLRLIETDHHANEEAVLGLDSPRMKHYGQDVLHCRAWQVCLSDTKASPQAKPQYVRVLNVFKHGSRTYGQRLPINGNLPFEPALEPLSTALSVTGTHACGLMLCRICRLLA